MDEREDQRRLIRSAPRKGDLVKVTNHATETYGIVINDIEALTSHQLKIFPETTIYFLKTGVISPISIEWVEIISNCYRDR